jgi:hypothetical protein
MTAGKTGAEHLPRVLANNDAATPTRPRSVVNLVSVGSGNVDAAGWCPRKHAVTSVSSPYSVTAAGSRGGAK